MRTKTLAVTVLSLTLIVITCSFYAVAAEVPRLSVTDLNAQLGDDQLTVVDTRSRRDWDNATQKIVGAKRGDPQQVNQWKDTLPKNGAIVLYCA